MAETAVSWRPLRGRKGTEERAAFTDETKGKEASKAEIKYTVENSVS